MKKYTKYIVALVCVALMVTGAILLVVFWKPNNTLTKAEYHEALEATQEIIQTKSENSEIATLALTPDDYEQMDDYGDVLLRQNRVLIFLVNVFANDEFEVTDQVITFKVNDFLGTPEIDFRMKFGIDKEMIFVDFIMNTGADSYEFFSASIDYDYTNQTVRSFTIDDYMSLSSEVGYNQTYYDGHDVLALKETSAQDAKAAAIEKGTTLRNTDNFVETDYDFTKEFKFAQADILKGQYHDTFEATSDTIKSNYNKVEDSDNVLKRQNRIMIFLINIFANEEFEVTDQVITFKVTDFGGAQEIDFRMKFGIDKEMIFVDFIMNMGADSYEYIGATIDYDYTNQKVRSFKIDDYMSPSGTYQQTYFDGNNVLILKEESAQAAKTAAIEKSNTLRTTTDFLDTDYDFTDEFKAAQADLMGNN